MICKKVLVFGTFDGLHEGHMDFFRQAKGHGDYLIAVVGRDSTVKKVKKHLPKFNEQERLKAVQECGLVNEAHLGKDNHDPRYDSYDIIKEIDPDVVCLGYDQVQFADKLALELKAMGLGNAEIKLLKPFEPEKYHSSILNK